MTEGSRKAAAPSRSALRVKWDNKRDEIRLLRLVRSNADYKATFFPTGMARREQYKVGRDLAIEFLKDDADQIRDWRRRGLIEKGEKGQWKAVNQAWDSRVSNPVMTKLRELKKSYEVAQDKYGKRLNPAWTKFSKVPNAIRVDLVDICPFYFHIKPLFAKNTSEEDIPPIRSPSPITVRQPTVKTGRPAQRVNGAPPSPSLSPSSRHRTSTPAHRRLPRPGPEDAESSNAVSSLPPAHTRPSNNSHLAVDPQHQPTSALPSHKRTHSVIDISSPSPVLCPTTARSSSSEDESEHDMENDWVDTRDAVGNEDPPDVDWLNMKADVSASAIAAGRQHGIDSRSRTRPDSPEPPAKRHRSAMKNTSLAASSDTEQARCSSKDSRLATTEASASKKQSREPANARLMAPLPPRPRLGAEQMKARIQADNQAMREKYKAIRPPSLGDKLFGATIYWTASYNEADLERYMSTTEHAAYQTAGVWQAQAIIRDMQLRLFIEALTELDTLSSVPRCLIGHHLFCPPNATKLVRKVVDFAVEAGAVLYTSVAALSEVDHQSFKTKTRIWPGWVHVHQKPGFGDCHYWKRSPTAFCQVFGDEIVACLTRRQASAL